MINLFRKQLKPKVFCIRYRAINTGQTHWWIVGGYTLEEVIEKAEKEHGGKIDISEFLETDLEELANEFTTEKVTLDNLKK